MFNKLNEAFAVNALKEEAKLSKLNQAEKYNLEKEVIFKEDLDTLSFAESAETLKEDSQEDAHEVSTEEPVHGEPEVEDEGLAADDMALEPEKELL